MSWLGDKIRYRKGEKGKRYVRPIEEQVFIIQLIVYGTLIPLMGFLGFWLMKG